MAAGIQIKGLEKVNKNLQKLSKQMPEATMRGLIKASILIRRDMDKTPPLVPVDTRNLQHSFFTVTSTQKGQQKGGGFSGKDAGKMESDHAAVTNKYSSEAQQQPKVKPTLIMGFSANYATFVHEARDGVKWQRPGAGSKFFESAIIRNEKKILEIIAKETKQQIGGNAV